MQISCYNPPMPVPNADGEYQILPFGNALRFYRKRKGLRQEDLAEETGLSQTTLSTWEGRAEAPSDDFALSVISDVLEVSLDDLKAGRVTRDQKESGDPLREYSARIARLYKGRVTPDELMRLFRGYVSLDAEGRKRAEEDIEWLRRIERRGRRPTDDEAEA